MYIDRAGCRAFSRHFETLDDLPLAPRQPGGASGPSPRFQWKLQLAEGHILGGVMTKAPSGSANGQKIAFSMKFPGLGGMGFGVSWDLPLQPLASRSK